MKAAAFFSAVFLTMLGLFIVATGEFKHWFGASATDRGGPRVSHNVNEDESEKNYLDFDFWNVKLGRRNFTLRAELPRGDLRDGARIDELDSLKLKNGAIEIPIYEGDGTAPLQREDQQPRGLLLEFESAVYQRTGGLVKGSGLITVTLYNGRGTTNEGTTFHFEELLFKNETQAQEKTRFILESKKPVSIVNPYLEVYSPAGLEGHSGSSGMEVLRFKAPVYTYLDPDVGGGLTLSEAGEQPPPDRDDKVIVTCEGGLELDFTHSGSETDRETTFITFNKNVLIFQGVRPKASGGAPVVGNTRFECQKLELEIDDRRKKPSPRRALATWEGGRVRARIARDSRTYLLDGDKLEWVNVSGADAGESSGRTFEGVLTGRPTLQGPDVDFVAERAIMRPHSERLFLQEVSGSFKMAGKEERRGQARLRAEQYVNQPGGNGGDDEAPGGAKRPTDRDELDRLDFDADEVEVAFNGLEEKGGEKNALTYFIARSNHPRGVVLRSKGWRRNAQPGEAEQAGPRSFQANGKTLTYRAEQQQATLEGLEKEFPRLSQGESWIEARKINLIVDGGPEGAWFEGSVSAKINLDDLRPAETEERGKKQPGDGEAQFVEIQSDYLGLLFEGGKALKKALARGDGTRPVRLTTRSKGLYRFSAPEVQLLARQKAFELIGTKEQRAQLEKKGGVVLAGKIRFEQESRQCTLTDAVEVRLYRGEEITSRPDLLIQAARADVEFAESVEGEASAEKAGPGVLRDLRSIRSLTAHSAEGSPLMVSGKSFEMRGEKASWSSSVRQLRFFGNTPQSMHLDHEELQGPVRAREIIYDEKSQSVTLRSEVKGELAQGAYREEPDGAGGARPGQKMLWEFETNELEVHLAKNEAGELHLSRVKAKDKILLYNRALAILLRGDDFLYEREQNKVKIFSQDGRRQTLQHFKDGFEAAGALGGEAAREKPKAERVDTIDAQEIEAYLYEAPAETAGGPLRRMVLVSFRRNVMANFHVDGKSEPQALPGTLSGQHWQVVAQRLALHVNPSAGPAVDQRLPWATASNIIGTDRLGGNVTINSGPYQAYAERVEYHASPRQLVLVGSRSSPATIADRRPQKRRPGFREQAPVIIIRKPKEEIEIEYLNRGPGKEPWPGVPEFLRD